MYKIPVSARAARPEISPARLPAFYCYTELISWYPIFPAKIIDNILVRFFAQQAYDIVLTLIRRCLDISNVVTTLIETTSCVSQNYLQKPRAKSFNLCACGQNMNTGAITIRLIFNHENKKYKNKKLKLCVNVKKICGWPG